jgi:hypothetical protein
MGSLALGPSAVAMRTSQRVTSPGAESHAGLSPVWQLREPPISAVPRAALGAEKLVSEAEKRAASG